MVGGRAWGAVEAWGWQTGEAFWGRTCPARVCKERRLHTWAQKLVSPAAASAGLTAAGQVSCAAWEEHPSELPLGSMGL